MSYYAGSGYYPTAYAGSSYGVPVARSYSSYDAPLMPTRQYYPTTPVYSAPPVVMSHRPSYSYPVSTVPMASPMPYYGSQPTVIISRSGRHHHRSSSRSSRSSSRHRSFFHYL